MAGGGKKRAKRKPWEDANVRVRSFVLQALLKVKKHREQVMSGPDFGLGPRSYSLSEIISILCLEYANRNGLALYEQLNEGMENAEQE